MTVVHSNDTFPGIPMTSVNSNYIIEPPRGKTNNVVSEQVPHKPTCTCTEAGYKLEISDLRSRGSVLYV